MLRVLLCALPLVTGAVARRLVDPLAGLEFGAAPRGAESLMEDKSYGTCPSEVQAALRWSVDRALANRIACHTRRYAERSGYWESTALPQAAAAGEEISFYDSVSGKLLFVAPRGRTMAEFLAESRAHGWPSFRDEEVVQENVRVLADGETVSVDGTHLGHNLPDGRNRYCIDLVSVAGQPRTQQPAPAPPGADCERCPILLDVRTAGEWGNGHATCAHRLPVQDDASLVDEVGVLAGGDFGWPIVTYCAAGPRAGRAETALQQAGYTNVRNGGGWVSPAGNAATLQALCDCTSGCEG